MIVLNKIDLVSDAEHEHLAGILHSLNPRVRIVSTSFDAVPLDRILNTHRFDFDAISAAPAWLAELRSEYVPETEALDVGSFVYRRRVPFRPQRL